MILSPSLTVKTKLIESAGRPAGQPAGEPFLCGLVRGEARTPVVFLHGFMGDREDWLHIASSLAEQYFCVLPDLPGHGANLHLPINEPLGFDMLNKQFLALLDLLALPRVHLVGYSLGGRVALYFALSHPERVASLILESASAGIIASDERRARAREDDQRAETILKEGLEAFVKHWYTLPLFRSLEQFPDLRAEIMARRKANHPGWMAKVIRELSPGRQPAVWDQLTHLEMPVLLVVGALDDKYLSIGEQMAAQIPHAHLEIVPGAGHTVHLDQSERLISILRAFIPLVQ